jgi:beta-phosphoglucomutase family hydrolase
MFDRLEAVLWDLDGVIADTGEYHYQAWQEVFGKRGANFSHKDFMHHFGQRHDTIIKFALGNLPPEEFRKITEEKQVSYRRRVANNIRALPGAITLLKSLVEHGIKSAIASSAPPENIDIILRGLGIKELFQAIAWGTEVAEGKPSPQIFLLAAEKLGVKPPDCVVIEDAIAGVTAAKRAGMKCVAVTNSHPGISLNKADLIVDTLEAITISDLTRLFQPPSTGR